MTVSSRRRAPLTLRAVLAGLLVTVATVAGCGTDEPAADSSRIRVGWQTPWATQGQVVQVLKHTDVLSRNHLTADFKGFSFGGPLNEAALAGEVDVLFTADQPAATLLARGGKYTIVARLMYNRVAIYVPPDSPIRTVNDLKGRRVAMPFGAAAQRVALAAMAEAGLDPQRDVESVNLDVAEQAAIVRAGSRSDWGDLDALVGFDPTPAIFEATGVARMLHVGTVVAVVMMSDAYLEAHPQQAKDFLRAYTQSWMWYARSPGQANQWFRAESGLTFEGDAPLTLAAAVEPNASATSVSGLRMTFDDADLATLQKAADFLADRKLVPTRVQMADHVDQDLIREVAAAVTDEQVAGVAAVSP